MIFKKISRYINTCILIIAGLGVSPLCFAEMSSDKTTIKEVRQETKELIKTLKSYASDQREEAIRKTKSALDNLDRRIDSLENRVDERWDKMDEAAREKARSSLKLLRKQRTQVAEWYGGLKNSSVDAWEHMKKGFSDAYNALYDAWEKAEQEFESSR